jgi:hypothetical protein
MMMTKLDVEPGMLRWTRTRTMTIRVAWHGMILQLFCNADCDITIAIVGVEHGVLTLAMKCTSARSVLYDCA